MSYVVTLTGFAPSPREDGQAWTRVRFEEAPAESGPFTEIETQTLSPVEPDPTEPMERDFTTHLATLESGWMRLVYLDAVGREETAGAVEFDTTAPPDYSPSTGDVAALLHARLRLEGGSVPESFTADTNPTASQVRRIIEQQTALVLIDTGDLSDDALICGQASSIRQAVRALIAQRAAAVIELSYWPEEVVASGRTAEEFWDRIAVDTQAKIVAAAHECRAGEVEPDGDAGGQAPVYSFPDAGEVLTYTTSGAIRRPFSREW